jgi:hypothetical protein
MGVKQLRAAPLFLFVAGSLLFFPITSKAAIDDLSDPGNPAIKTDWRLGLREFPANFFDFDPTAYLVQTQTIHGTEIVVAIHNSLVGIADIQGFAVPTPQEFADFVFQVFHRYWHVFNGFLYNRYTVKVNALSDPQTFGGASEVGLILGNTGPSSISNFPPHHYTRAMFDEFVAHEIFHAWNGRTFTWVPSGDGRLFQLETWIQEGATVYYSAWVRALVQNLAHFRNGLLSRWNQYTEMVGTEFDLSIEELTFQIGPPSGNFTNMLYARSAMINYMLDRELSRLGVSLDSLMRHLYENFGLMGKRWAQADIPGILQAKSGRNFLDFFASFLHTNAILPLGGNFLFVNHPESVASPRLANISTRSRVLTDDNVTIGGFVISGSASKRVLVRSRGPALAAAPFFVAGTLADPLLRLFSGPTVIAQNDNWQDAPNCSSSFVCEGATQIVATGLDPCEPNPGEIAPPPNCALEAAILVTLPPGAYTAIVTGANGGIGVGLVEVFEADATTDSALINISTRAIVQTEDNVLIGGLVVQGDAPKTVLVRARGPALAAPPFFVEGTLANPFLRLFSGPTVIAQNDNWQDAPNCSSGFVCGGVAEVIATGLDPCQPHPGETTAPPGCALESAILISVPPGAYTAIVSGVGGGTGVGLVEVFEVD